MDTKVSTLRSQLTGQAMTHAQFEFTSRSRIFVAGDTFIGWASDTPYRVLAVGKMLPQGQLVLAEDQR
jgi:hypothetical protein